MSIAPTGVYIPVHDRTFILEVSTEDALNETQTWLNLSELVLARAGGMRNPIVIEHGVDPKDRSFQAASLDLWVDNTARQLDTTNEDSPFHDALQARRQIRLRTHAGKPSHVAGDYWLDVFSDSFLGEGRYVADADTQLLFLGFVIEWPRQYGLSNQFSWVKISAKDGSLLLDNTELDDGALTFDDDVYGFLDSDSLLGTSDDDSLEDGTINVLPTGTLLDEVLDAVEWPTTLRDVEAGVTTAGITNGSESIVGTLQTLHVAEHGAALFWPDGRLGFLSRLWPWTRARAVETQATFGAGAIPFTDVEGVGPDGTRLRTHWRRTGLQGHEIIRTDEQARRRWGRIRDSVTSVANAHDPDIEGDLDLLKARYATQVERIDTLTVAGTPFHEGERISEALIGLEPLDRIAVALRPPGGAPYPTSEHNILRRRREISREGWTEVFHLDPAALEELFTLDSSDSPLASPLDGDLVLAP